MYTLDDYRIDVREGYLLAPAQRGAAFAAASKRLKQAIVLQWLKTMSDEQGVDLTPTLANHIAAAWMGRSVDRLVLLDWFARQGRTAANKSRDHGRRDALIAEYQAVVDTALAHAQEAMTLVRAEERAKLFKS